jgi:hypothetical protein
MGASDPISLFDKNDVRRNFDTVPGAIILTRREGVPDMGFGVCAFMGMEKRARAEGLTVH